MPGVPPAEGPALEPAARLVSLSATLRGILLHGNHLLKHVFTLANVANVVKQ